MEVPLYKDEQSMICDGGRSSKDSEQRVVKLKEYPNKVLPLQNLDGNNNMPEFSDMVMLPYLHEVRLQNDSNKLCNSSSRSFAHVCCFLLYR